MQIKELWKVVLEGGATYQYPQNWMLINTPIESLQVGSRILSGKEQYFVVYHAVATPGFQGSLTAFEYGFVKGQEVTSYIVKPQKDKQFNVTIVKALLKDFKYVSALKSGKKR